MKITYSKSKQRLSVHTSLETCYLLPDYGDTWIHFDGNLEDIIQYFKDIKAKEDSLGPLPKDDSLKDSDLGGPYYIRRYVFKSALDYPNNIILVDSLTHSNWLGGNKFIVTLHNQDHKTVCLNKIIELYERNKIEIVN